MNPLFRMDETSALEVLDDVGVGDLVVVGPDGIEAVRLPYVVEPQGGPSVVVGHVARANLLWRLAESPVEALLIVHGPEAYVSPSWYATKAVDGRVVPTWNHVTVQVRGVLTAVTDDAEKAGIVRRLTARFEAGRAMPWSVDDAPAEFITTMVRGIVGLRLTVTGLTGIAKLSQNRSEDDVAGVIDGLRSGSPLEREVATSMAHRVTGSGQLPRI